MSEEFTPCNKETCQCQNLINELKEAKNPSRWEMGVEFFSTDYIQEALDMQLHICKRIKNPFYC